MGWLSLFSFDSSSSRKGQALSSTHEAFSLPTSSSMFTPQHRDSFSAPDPESATSPSFTYPPQGASPYGYVPQTAGLTSRQGPLLPTHHDSLHTPSSPMAPYPPLAVTWNRLRAWLNREYPELGDTLNYGILPQDLAQIELQFGFALPAVVRDSYLAVDGQEAESAAGCSEGLFFGLTLLPLEDVYEEWRFWREVDEDPSTGANPNLREAMQSIPPGWIRSEYSQRGWIPLIADKVGNYVGVDLNPGEGGSVGQVIVFGRDFDTKIVLWNGDGGAGWAKWLASFVDELENGEGFEIGTTQGDDNSEDGLGYEGYFYDGTGRGQGDGGGDTGTGGGLRLTGEYWGWNVLEAWADRSLRKWHEVGIVTDLSLAPEDSKAKTADKVGLGVKDLRQESAVQVPIPVLTDEKAALSTPRSALATVPTISVTRAPAPKPVDLPTADDIVPAPSPPESIHTSDDLEAGRHIMREVSEPGIRPPSVASAPSPLSMPPVPSKIEAVEASPAATIIPDLLSEAALDVSTPPLEPSSPASPLTPLVTESKLTPSSSSETTESAAPETPHEPDTTVRLVGGGGTSGVAPNGIEPGVDDDTASINSVNSNSTAAPAKKHKKTPSGLASLKKLGQIGRKKASNSNGGVKEMMATPSV
ncbi:hypothetical protein BDN72DRAFT_836533 [Pluteus cervinus]|uniref:Uncharacterized protein n=1 Tax=Pluteus cervinus TaxID=181527 RepID=A0ACD3B3C2_9AGAR|nr:hypothetical protein BDN72DRAFT_836533 [Pluteus cervinus]